MASIKIGPDGTGSYRYMIDGTLSAACYHNAASARHDARRPQRLDDDGLLTPDTSALAPTATGEGHKAATGSAA